MMPQERRSVNIVLSTHLGHFESKTGSPQLEIAHLSPQPSWKFGLMLPSPAGQRTRRATCHAPEPPAAARAPCPTPPCWSDRLAPARWDDAYAPPRHASR